MAYEIAMCRIASRVLNDARRLRPSLRALMFKIFLLAVPFFALSARAVQAQDQPTTVRGVYHGRVSDDAIYAFDVEGLRRTYRCTFCPFYFAEVKRGDSMELHVKRSVITSVVMSDGRVLNDKNARSRRYSWAIKVLLIAGLLLMILSYLTKRKHKEMT